MSDQTVSTEHRESANHIGVPGNPAAVERVAANRKKRFAKRRLYIAVLAVLVAVGFVFTLMVGQSFTPLDEVVRVIMGEDVPGASFTVGSLRLPRAALSVLVGFAFGLAGAAYQTMLRNSLASPDIIGISYSASAAAVVGIVFFGLDGPSVSSLSIVVSLGVAVFIYLLSFKGGVAGTRLILIGIAMAALSQSVISYALSRAGEWDTQEALRWLSGSVNGASWEQIVPVAVALPLFGTLLFANGRNLETLRLGDDASAALGVRVAGTRIVVLIAATGLIAFATAAAGPVSFVAFLSAPIASRLVGRSGSILLPAALTGALLVQVADYCGQFLLPSRFPVGVVTGALGAPYLLFLIARSNRRGGSL